MDSKDDKEPLGGSKSRGQSRRHTAQGRSAKQSKRSVEHPGQSEQTAPSESPQDPLLEKPDEQVSPSEKAAIQKRAEGRTRVPAKFRDGLKHFFFTPTGALKIVRLGLLIGALTCFITSEAHESHIVITITETCIVTAFILIYMLSLNRLLTYIHWPLLDLMNSLITTVFLLIVATLTMREKERRHLFYVGGCLCLTAAIVCLIDAALVTKMMRSKMKKVLRIQPETSSSPAPEEPAPNPNLEPEKELTPPFSRASSVASTAAPSQAPSKASLRPKAAAPRSHSRSTRR